MARLTFPSDRLVYKASTYAGSAFSSSSGSTATVYSDAGGTTLADVQNIDGSANVTATFTVDSTSRLPLFLGPANGTDTLYVKIDAGPVTAIYAVTAGDISSAVGVEVAARQAADAALAKPRGAWVTATAYAVNDVVTSSGAAYRCLVAHTSGGSFSGAGTNWEAWANSAASSAVVVAAPTGVAATDDAAILAAHTALSATGGSLLLQAGTYATAGGSLVFTKPTVLRGNGRGSSTSLNAPTRITCASTTANAVEFQGDGSGLVDLAIVNTSGGTQTAGVGALFTAGNGAHVSRVKIANFWDNISFVNGAYWTVTDSTFLDQFRYGIRIRDLANADQGDQSIIGCSFVAGQLVSKAGIAANLRWESGGGLKVTNTKFNGSSSTGAAIGVDISIADGAGTVDILVSNCSIENNTTCGVQVTQAGPTNSGNLSHVMIHGNQISTLNTNTYGVKVFNPVGGTGGVNTVLLSNNMFDADLGGVWLNNVTGICEYGNQFNTSHPLVVEGGTGTAVSYVEPWRIRNEIDFTKQSDGTTFALIKRDPSNTDLPMWVTRYTRGYNLAGTVEQWRLDHTGNGDSFLPSFTHVGSTSGPYLHNQSNTVLSINRNAGSYADLIAATLAQGTGTAPGVSGALSADLATGGLFIAALTGNITSFAFTNAGTSGQMIEVHFVQDATGSRTLSGASASIKWAGGAAPTLTTTASRRDIFRFTQISGSYYEVSRSMNVG